MLRQQKKNIASVGANSGIVRRFCRNRGKPLSPSGFSRREFRNREAVKKELDLLEKLIASVGANSGIVRR